MNLRSALQLGRVSNLPTVWTNTLAGMVLAGAGVIGFEIVPVLLAFSLFYVGGMFLNDAFDAEFDARHRPERPIPAGLVSRRSVFAYGYGLMALGLALLAAVGLAGRSGIWPALAGLGLAATISFYNWHHKGNPWSPVVMGLCRVLVLLGAGLCVTLAPAAALWVALGLMLAYLIGLTYVAKQENLERVENLWPLLFLAAPLVYGAWLSLQHGAVTLFWLLLCGWVALALALLRRRAKGDIPRAVVSLIAGIALLDAMLIAGSGALGLAMMALAGFALTLLLQRVVSGT